MPKAGIQFSQKDTWLTPREVVDFFGPFDYDPATTKEQAQYLGVPNYDTIETDGLISDWARYNKIWCNPPFTRKFEFLEKAVTSMAKTFFLIPIETLTTKTFHNIIKDVDYTIWIPNGRIKFIDRERERESCPAFGSVVLEIPSDEKVIRHWKLYGENSRK